MQIINNPKQLEILNILFSKGESLKVKFQEIMNVISQ